MEIELSAYKHKVSAEDMIHAIRQHWRAYQTDDPEVTMFIGPAQNGEPLEIGVIEDDEGTAIIHAMSARPKFLKGWWI